MGQKTHPYGFRLGITKPWVSRWFTANKDYSNLLVEDRYIRKTIKEKLYKSGISKIDIERKANSVLVTIYTAKPGMVVGKQGKDIEELKEHLSKKFGKKTQMDVQEIKNIDLEAQLVAESIAQQLEKRVAFRRAMKQAISKTMKAGAKGIKVMCAGRLGGVEIARTEWIKEGRIPLQTLRADIDYGFSEADTVFGKIGVKVWICKGEIFPGQFNKKLGGKANVNA
ncbi:MAG: 30S ribosomal protein S3 [Candidatus Sericytochromatia bacterium]|nr:MAG: 30S ribosomal protein S3 [Candidatus Sericytochromatia bacterium]